MAPTIGICTLLHSICTLLHSICTVLHSICTILHSICTVLHSICTILHSICTILHSICTILHSICTILHSICTILHSILYNIAQYFVQYCTVFCTVLHSILYTFILNFSSEVGDKPTAQLERMLLHTLNDLTQQLKTKIDKSAVYSLYVMFYLTFYLLLSHHLSSQNTRKYFVSKVYTTRHIKEELDSLAGNNTPEDFVANSISVPPPPGSDNNAIPDSVRG